MSENPFQQRERESSSALSGRGVPLGKRATLISLAVLIGYPVAACIYLAYGLVTQGGLFGYLTSVEVTIFGAAYQRLTFVVGMLILCSPIAIGVLVVNRVAPSVFHRPLYNPPTSPRQHRFLTSWRGPVVISTVPFAATLVIGGIALMQANEELRQPVYRADLSISTEEIPQAAQFVKLTGILAADYATGYREGATEYTIHVYVPITGTRWTPAQPIRYVVHHETLTSHATGRPVLPDAFRVAGPAPFTGQLKTSLPVLVKREWNRKGLKLAPAYRVVDWMELPGDKVPVSGRYEPAFWIFGVGLFVTLTILFIMMFFGRVLWSVARARRTHDAVMHVREALDNRQSSSD
jgi:hypothetical protein